MRSETYRRQVHDQVSHRQITANYAVGTFLRAVGMRCGYLLWFSWFVIACQLPAQLDEDRTLKVAVFYRLDSLFSICSENVFWKCMFKVLAVSSRRWHFRTTFQRSLYFLWLPPYIDRMASSRPKGWRLLFFRRRHDTIILLLFRQQLVEACTKAYVSSASYIALLSRWNHHESTKRLRKRSDSFGNSFNWNLTLWSPVPVVSENENEVLKNLLTLLSVNNI